MAQNTEHSIALPEHPEVHVEASGGSVQDPEVSLIQEAAGIVGSQRIAVWLETPLPALDGKTAISLLHSEEGRAEVERLLIGIEHGVY